MTTVKFNDMLNDDNRELNTYYKNYMLECIEPSGFVDTPWLVSTKEEASKSVIEFLMHYGLVSNAFEAAAYGIEIKTKPLGQWLVVAGYQIRLVGNMTW